MESTASSSKFDLLVQSAVTDTAIIPDRFTESRPTLISDGLGLQKLSSTSILKCPPRDEVPSSMVMPWLGSMLPYSLLHMFMGE